jgi:hypothetical protein
MKVFIFVADTLHCPPDVWIFEKILNYDLELLIFKFN